MRCAVLADVHANLHALTAVLAALRRDRVDRYVCAGDLVGYGPLPNECVELLFSLPLTAVAGNHELMVRGVLGTERCTPLARASVTWTRGALADRTLARLVTLPEVTVLPGSVVAHGSLSDATEYVRQPAQARRQLDQLTRTHPAADVLLLGHTHTAWAFGSRRGTVLHQAAGVVDLTRDDRWLLNPGSVGQPRDGKPLARFLVLDLDSRTATFHAVPFDVAGCRRALGAAGLPADSCQPTVSPTRRVRAAAGRLARMARP